MSEARKSSWSDVVGCLGITLIFAAVLVVGLLLAFGWRP
jgi:hypothetical protein